MGGHGALISFFKRPGQYKSVSAFAPICSASECEWSRNAFQKFFGESLKKIFIRSLKNSFHFSR
jgi:S-formylglutathione hydrolase